jgi:hypothetical protein
MSSGTQDCCVPKTFRCHQEADHPAGFGNTPADRPNSAASAGRRARAVTKGPHSNTALATMYRRRPVHGPEQHMGLRRTVAQSTDGLTQVQAGHGDGRRTVGKWLRLRGLGGAHGPSAPDENHRHHPPSLAARPPTGRSAPPDRLEPACRVAGVHSGRTVARPAGRTVDTRRPPHENVDAPMRGARVAEKLDRADECEAERR